MKALVLEAYNRLAYKEMPDPQVGPDEVLIRVKAAEICGSDVHGMDGSTGRRIPPLIMGHEASGVVEDTGSNMEAYVPGQRVTFDSTVYCGVCYFCRRGADVAFDAVGLNASLKTALEGLRKGGALTLIGNLKPQPCKPWLPEK
jgi:threonine dehydrogenase-like Zn-dependent dehydrogenase